MTDTSSYKRPESVLVVVYTKDGDTLLLRRADRPDFWQSVTGAMNHDERDPRQTAARELFEETGIRVDPRELRDLKLTQRFSIFPEWRHRYAPGVIENVEHAFAIELPQAAAPVMGDEHVAHGWFSFDDALKKISSWTNRQALRVALDRRELVILIHGLWLGGWCMALLAHRLRRAGFDTRSVSYKTVRADLRENAMSLQQAIAPLPHTVVHFVAHSLGGIVARALFHYFPQQRPGRIVTLATPHQGSLIACRLARYRLGAAILGKCMRDLADNSPREWPLPARDIGMIGGTRSFGFGCFFTKMDAPNDGTVFTHETTLSGLPAPLLLPVTHTGILLSRRVADAVIRFICQGNFE